MALIAILGAIWGFAVVPLQAAIAKDQAGIDAIAAALRLVENASEASKQADTESRADRAQTDTRVRALEETLKRLAADFQSSEARNTATAAEIETQFKAVSIVTNDQQGYNQQTFGLLFAKVFPGSTLVPMTYRPQLNK